MSLIPAEWIQLCASHTGVERRGWGDLGRVCVGVGMLDSNGMTEKTATKIETDRGDEWDADRQKGLGNFRSLI